MLRFKLLVPMTVLELEILIVFGVWFVRNLGLLAAGIRNRLAKRTGAIEYPFGPEMILVLAAGLFGVGVAGFSNEALGIWKAYFFEPVLFLIVVYQVVGRLDVSLEEKSKNIIWPLLCSGLLVSVLAIYQKWTGNLIDNPLWQASATRRVVSVFGYPNAVGLYLETIIVYCFGLLLAAKERKAQAILYGGLIALFILAIAFAKSNGAALGLAAGAALFAVLYTRQSRKAFLIAFGVAVAAVMIMPATRGKALDRLELQDFSGQVRLIGWQETWRMLSDGRLLTGAGLSQFQAAVAPYHVPGFYYNKDRDPDFHRKLVLFDQKYRDQFWQPLEIYMYPHNIILNFWSEVGLIGLLAFVWLVVKFYYLSAKCFRNSQGDRRLLMIISMTAMTVVAVHGLVDVPFFKNDLAVLFWLPILLVGLYRLELEQGDLKELPK